MKQIEVNNMSIIENKLSESELNEIIVDYKKNIQEYNYKCEYLIKKFYRKKNVHLINYRIKDPEHLREKIVRKNKEGRNIDINNYKEKITDLIGIRIIHVFKNEWKNINEYIRENFELIETPIAYVRKGDIKESVYNRNNFNVKFHPFGYRSLHYVFEDKEYNSKIIGEIQVRTIFEEAWSEIDHSVRYPNFSDNKIIEEYSMIINRLAGMGDEMGLNLKNLTKTFDKQDKEINQFINKLNIAQKEKQQLVEKINNRNMLLGAGALIGLINKNKNTK